MLTTIMLPTDGSPESDRAVPVAGAIATAQGSKLLLVQIVSMPIATEDAQVDGEAYQGTIEILEASAQANLDELAARLRAMGVTVEPTRLLGGPGRPGWALLNFENQHEPVLVVMATHGRTGVARLALGSVADQMVREGTAPVLLIREEPPSGFSRALVMLDGSGLAEEVLEVVQQLTPRPLESITLFEAVEDERDRRPAMTYLEGVAGTLARLGLKADATVGVGDPATLAHAAAEHVDLVALCTHGRSGFDRWRHGSVAQRVVRESTKPVLLVRARSAA